MAAFTIMQVFVLQHLPGSKPSWKSVLQTYMRAAHCSSQGFDQSKVAHKLYYLQKGFQAFPEMTALMESLKSFSPYEELIH